MVTLDTNCATRRKETAENLSIRNSMSIDQHTSSTDYSYVHTVTNLITANHQMWSHTASVTACCPVPLLLVVFALSSPIGSGNVDSPLRT